MLTVGRRAQHRAWDRARTLIARSSQASPDAPALAGALLGPLAVIEAITRAAVAGVGVRGGIVLCLLALATTLPLALLRPPAASVAVSSASVGSLALFDALTVAGLVTELIVLHRLGRGNGRPATVTLALPFAVLALAGPPDSAAWTQTIVLAAVAPAAVLTGLVARAQHDATEHSAARDAIAGTLVEHAARGERARISRELHDVVAHHISMIAVEAETARITNPGMPPATERRLSAIGDTARAALTEMRRLLGVLREDTGTEPSDLEPQPDLRQLNELLDRARDASGTVTRLILRGPPVTLDPAVELTAYRIVQEALTNARRHAPGAAVDVELHYTGDDLSLRIRDNGPGPPTPATPGPGLGLLSMRERAAAVGGELRTGAAAGGGFLITATLPGKGQEGG
jgi:signal transduction histidine kinase